MSIWENGFKRIVVLNGHGGNAAPNRVIRDILSERNVFPIAYNWWDSVEDVISKSSDSDSDVGHGGEWETLTQLFIREQLVSKPHIGADVPLMSPFDPETARFASFAERRRDTRNRTGIMGDTHVATKEKGKAILTLAINCLVMLLREFHSLSIREYREFGTHCP